MEIWSSYEEQAKLLNEGEERLMSDHNNEYYSLQYSRMVDINDKIKQKFKKNASL